MIEKKELGRNKSLKIINWQLCPHCDNLMKQTHLHGDGYQEPREYRYDCKCGKKFYWWQGGRIVEEIIKED